MLCNVCVYISPPPLQPLVSSSPPPLQARAQREKTAGGDTEEGEREQGHLHIEALCFFDLCFSLHYPILSI